jgi:nicotinamidase-related amidase
MSTLNLNVTYYQDSTPEDVPCREENFVRRTLLFPLPVEQTALVLIDLWDIHHIESWVARAGAMTRDVIVPLIDKARKTGLTIVFAPSPQVAYGHPDKYKVYEGRTPAPQPGPAPTWPPPEFRGRQGECARFRNPRNQPPGIGLHWPTHKKLDMSPFVKVQAGDFVVADGRQLHDLFEERGILHMLVAGFATNWCILGRDYGVRAMAARGYNVILLRDATEGVEFPDTLEQRWATELATREVEQVHGFCASNEAFYAACNAAAKGRERKTITAENSGIINGLAKHIAEGRSGEEK